MIHTEGLNLIRQHNEECRHRRTEELIRKRKRRDKILSDVEIALLITGGILLLNEDIRLPQIIVSVCFLIAGYSVDVIRRYV